MGMGGYGMGMGGMGMGMGYGGMGMMGMMGSPMGLMGLMPPGSFGSAAIENIARSVAVLGQVTQLVGMSTHALHHTFGSMIDLVLHVGSSLGLLKHAQPQLGPDGRPLPGQPPMGPIDPEQRQKVMKWIFRGFLMYILYVVVKMLRGGKETAKKSLSNVAMNNIYNSGRGGGMGSSMGMMGGMGGMPGGGVGGGMPFGGMPGGGMGGNPFPGGFPGR